MFDRQWYQLHPVTCIILCASLAAISYLNCRCRIFFGPGGTSVLRFSHGWPLPFREAPITGPGQINPYPAGALPNFIWGHPEFNDDLKIMQAIEADIHDFPRRPWQLHHVGKFSLLFATIDLLITIAAVTTVGCLSEILVRNNNWQIDNHLSLGLSFTLVVVLCAPLLITPQAPLYAAAVLSVLLVALVAIAKVLSVGYRNA